MQTRHNLNRLAYFVAVVEEGGITAAANRLGLSKAVVSKQLQQLEQEVGVSLISRNTRHIRLTEQGHAFHQRCSAVLAQANEAYEALLEQSSVPSGLIRITASIDYGVAYVAPVVARFCDRYPRVEVDLNLNDERQDIVEQRYDLAFRIGWLADSSNRALKLQDFTEVAVCSPATLASFPIETPEDLAARPFIASSALGGATTWTFSADKNTAVVSFRTALTANSTLAIREAVLHGEGFSILPDFLVAQELADEKLVVLVPDWSLRSGGVYAVSPPSRLRTRAVDAFVEMVKAAI